MSIKTYNKLVRDNIPGVIRGDGQIPHTRIITDFKEKDNALRRKLLEEGQEVVDASSQRNLVTELADLFEVGYALIELHHFSPAAIERERLKRRRERGGFKDFVFLESIETPKSEDGQH